MNTDTLQREDLATGTTPSTATTSPLQEVKEATTQQVKQVASDLKESGTEALQTAKEAGNTFVHDQKESIAAKIDCYTQAVKAACDSLRGGEGNLLVTPAERASRQLEKASDYLRNRDATDFLRDLGDLARRKPEIVFGGLFIAGMASVRFLKASARDQSSQRNWGNGATNRPPPPQSPTNFGPGSGTLATRPSNINPALLK